MGIMPSIIIADGTVHQFPTNLKGYEIAKRLSAPKQVIAIKINGIPSDLSTIIPDQAKIEFIQRDEPLGLEILRHDCAHVLAQAVQELFPGTQITFGPAIENGFYYDFARETPFALEDLPKIEKRMQEIVTRNLPITRHIWSRDQAIKFFKSKGEIFKAEHVATIPTSEPISVYQQGDFTDLCTGPHLTGTGQLGKAFRLSKISGSYWRGDANNAKLQRIYGTCWANEQQLTDYLLQLEEAEKRDHRRLGRSMDLFHLQEEAVGSVFWHPKGWTLYRTLENYVRSQLAQYNYQEVKTPLLFDKSLWEKSGHWEKYRKDMFVFQEEGQILGLKPMNCPAHVQIFRQGITSYRDLPLRMAEFGCCHRNEASGSLHGIMRVRSFTQDDAHIFCTENQVVEETINFCQLLAKMYRDLGFPEFTVKLADRPALRAGTDEVWDKAEKILHQAIKKAGIPYTVNAGEGAFYGPKLEFYLKDSIGRVWQCGTLQVDYIMPERLDASYIAEDGSKRRPVMLHRAVLGSMERFMGILIEHHGGRFPLWLAPLQVVVANITDASADYAKDIYEKLRKANIRVHLDIRNEKITYKIREHSESKIPLIFVVGNREAEQQQVAIRRLSGKDQEIVSLEAAIQQLHQECQQPL